jgi:hypothetical protein
MRCLIGLAALALVGACSQEPKQQHLPAAGAYLGLESMGPSHRDVTPDDITDRWYHENRLTIRGDSVFLERVPVVVDKDGEKGYSASDGGFYSYQGRIRQYPDSLVAHLRLVNSDYVLARYRLVKSVAQDTTLSLDEQVKRGMLVRDSSQLRKWYPLTVWADSLGMNGVTYRPKK